MKHSIKIYGMTCGHCAARVKKALEAIGAKDVNVDVASGLAEMTYSNSIEDLYEAIEDSGFDVVKE